MTETDLRVISGQKCTRLQMNMKYFFAIRFTHHILTHPNQLVNTAHNLIFFGSYIQLLVVCGNRTK